MEPEIVFVLTSVFLIALAVMLRLFFGVLNHARIKEYIASKGGTVTEIRWVLFGPGWFGSSGHVIYKIRYYDSDGYEHYAYCKTSILCGVYMTEDKIVGVAKQQPQNNVTLEEENRQLKEEIRRLKGD